MSLAAIEGGASLGKALLDAAGKPILTRRTVTEQETEYGEPKTVEQGLSITPAAILALAAAAWLTGLKVGVGADVTGRMRFGIKERPPMTSFPLVSLGSGLPQLEVPAFGGIPIPAALIPSQVLRSSNVALSAIAGNPMWVISPPLAALQQAGLIPKL